MKITLCEVKKDGKHWHITEDTKFTLCGKIVGWVGESKELPPDTKYICKDCLELSRNTKETE